MAETQQTIVQVAARGKWQAPIAGVFSLLIATTVPINVPPACGLCRSGIATTAGPPRPPAARSPTRPLLPAASFSATRALLPPHPLCTLLLCSLPHSGAQVQHGAPGGGSDGDAGPRAGARPGPGAGAPAAAPRQPRRPLLLPGWVGGWVGGWGRLSRQVQPDGAASAAMHWARVGK